VLSWALTHTRADPQRIGMLGMSYGAGIALLTAAHDKRVRAVVATSSWADMAGALDFNDTPSTAALQLLLGGSRSYDATVRRLRDALAGAPQSLASILRGMSPARSADSYLAELNRNKPAIMLANAFEDSILSPGQLVPFFNRLTGPKRLELAEGDHGGPEFPSLLGGSSATIDDAVAWLDHYVRGVANGIDKRQPILLRAIGTSQARGFSAWPKAADRVALGRPGSTDRSAAWTATLQAGADSAATNGPAQFARGANYQPQQLVLAALDRHRALVWTGDRLATSTSLNGTPTVHLTLASAARAATVFAYLYDVAPDGAGTLLDMAPYSATGLTTSRAVTFDMQPTSYTVPAGHRIALVVDAADPRYPSLAPRGTTLTVSSSSADPAALTLPTSA
jgi:putative CocE/NonD family hydrolase